MPFTQQTKQGIVFHTADAFSAAGGVAHGFATRLGGVSKPPFDQLNLGMTRRDDPQDVVENYRRLCAALGTDVDHLVMTHQVHQDTILEAKPEHVLEALLEPIGYDTDGLMTDIPGLCLTIYYADCIPVLLYDPVKQAIAAVHSGWRGTSLGIAPQAVQKMAARYGSDPRDILVAIGPGIGPCCFETHDDVPTAMAEQLGEGVKPFCQPLPNGKFSVDLKGIIRWELVQAGVPDGNIDTLPLCTACHPELYWSHRKMGDRRGNHAAMIQLL